jgi:hypothetical protein
MCRWLRKSEHQSRHQSVPGHLGRFGPRSRCSPSCTRCGCCQGWLPSRLRCHCNTAPCSLGSGPQMPHIETESNSRQLQIAHKALCPLPACWSGSRSSSLRRRNCKLCLWGWCRLWFALSLRKLAPAKAGLRVRFVEGFHASTPLAVSTCWIVSGLPLTLSLYHLKNGQSVRENIQENLETRPEGETSEFESVKVGEAGKPRDRCRFPTDGSPPRIQDERPRNSGRASQGGKGVTDRH